MEGNTETDTKTHNQKEETGKTNTIEEEVKVTKIKYGGKELSLEEMKTKITEWNQSLTNDTNENYIKFNTFCSKLDEGAFIWHFGEPYGQDFTGYHSNGRKCNYILYQTKNNPEMIFHGFLARRIHDSRQFTYSETDYLSKDGSSGSLAKDYNFKFYYVPKSELKLISDLHSEVSPIYKYEDCIKTLPKKLIEIVYKRKFDIIDDDIRVFISDYF
jgi:hypothetical protein